MLLPVRALVRVRGTRTIPAIRRGKAENAAAPTRPARARPDNGGAACDNRLARVEADLKCGQPPGRTGPRACVPPVPIHASSTSSTEPIGTIPWLQRAAIVGSVRQRRGRGAATAKVQPGPCAVGNRVHECCDAQHGPAKANPSDVDAQRGSKDDHGREQVEDGFAEIGDGQPCGSVPSTGGEPGYRDAPATENEAKEDPIERDSARLPVRMGTGSVQWHCLSWRTDKPAGVDGESSDHV